MTTIIATKVKIYYFFRNKKHICS